MKIILFFQQNKWMEVFHLTFLVHWSFSNYFSVLNTKGGCRILATFTFKADTKGVDLSVSWVLILQTHCLPAFSILQILPALMSNFAIVKGLVLTTWMKNKDCFLFVAYSFLYFVFCHLQNHSVGNLLLFCCFVG